MCGQVEAMHHVFNAYVKGSELQRPYCSPAMPAAQTYDLRLGRELLERRLLKLNHFWD